MLSNKIVLISGAGSGLGRALSIAFCKAGATVFGLGRTKQKLLETQSIINEQLPTPNNQFFYFECDISDYQQVKLHIQSIINSHHRIDYLFNNAAIYKKINFLEESSEDFSKALNTNVLGMVNVCKAVLPEMIKSHFGRIYNVGSFADINPIANSAAYSATKGAIHGLTKGIAADINHLNLDIEVHEWVPGHVNTGMSDFTGLNPSIPADWAVNISQLKATKKSTLFNEDKEFFISQPSILKRIMRKLIG